MNRYIQNVRRASALWLLAACVLAYPGKASAQTDTAPEMKLGHTALDALADRSGKRFDIAFVSQMVMHHRSGIQFSQDTLKRLRDEEVKQLARDIIREETREIHEMTSNMKRWYDVLPSNVQMALVKADMAPMLEKTVYSDRVYLEWMILHHRQAVEMARLAKDKAAHPEVKTLAEKIEQSQSREREALRKKLDSLPDSRR